MIAHSDVALRMTNRPLKGYCPHYMTHFKFWGPQSYLWYGWSQELSNFVYRWYVGSAPGQRHSCNGQL